MRKQSSGISREAGPIGIEPHVYSKDILERVAACHENDNFHGLLDTAENWLVISVSIAVSLWAWQHLAAPLALGIYLLAVFAIGGRQRSLADLLHQASHGILTRSYRFGVLLGTVFCGYPVLQSFTSYQHSHVRCHHENFGDPRLDPDYVHYRQSGLCGENMSSDAVRRYLLRLFTASAIIGYLRYVVVNRIWTSHEDPRERALRLTFIGGALVGVIAAGWLDRVVLYWLVPLLTTSAWIGAVTELIEHYPMIETAQRVDIFMSRNRLCGRLSTFCLGLKQYEGYHVIHHTFPRLPPWRNQEVHRILLEDPVYRSVSQLRGWRMALRDVVHLGNALPENA